MKKFFRILFVSFFLFERSFGVELIRDVEIETILTEMVKPIFIIAGLNEESAKVFVINSDEINAFTIGNGYIFVTSELLFKFKDHTQLIAILSHEAAHIAAGHVNRLTAIVLNRQRNTTKALLAGLLATVFTRSEAAMAATLGYIMTDDRFFLRYSRGEEFAADSLGASYLAKLGYDPKCMISVFETFQKEGIINGGEHIPEYIKSHPDTNSRISAIKNSICLHKRDCTKNLSAKRIELLQKLKAFLKKQYSCLSKDKIDGILSEKYSRISKKLKAFLKKQYSSKDDYSHAIYLYRHGNVKKALKIMKELMRKNPKDIFYKETLAQLLYETGNLKQSIAIYKQIYRDNLNPLIKKDYAEVLIEANQNLKEAISILENIKYKEPLDSDIYRLLAKAYGKQNKIGISKFMLAQEQLILGNYRESKHLINTCLSKLNKKTEQSYINKAKYVKELIERKIK